MLAPSNEERRRGARNGHDEAIKEIVPRLRPARRRPQRRPPRKPRKPGCQSDAKPPVAEAQDRATASRSRSRTATEFDLDHGRVVIAAITSCTNTSNPSVMIGAGLLAKKAVERGLDVQAVGEDVAGARLHRRHRLPRAVGPRRVPEQARVRPRRLRLHHLHRQLGPAARRRSPRRSTRRTSSSAAVLSGNRNFEGRINQDVQGQLPRLAAALRRLRARRPDGLRLRDRAARRATPTARTSSSRDIWPTLGGDQGHGRRRGPRRHVQEELRRTSSRATSAGRRSRSPRSDRYTWPDSTYVRRPPFFEGMDAEPAAELEPIEGARVLAKLGDSITTDHISPPARSRRTARPASG